MGRAIQDAGWRASDVNLTAETLNLVRGSHATSLATTLDSRKVDPRILETILRLAQSRPVEVCAEDTKLIPVSAAHDAYAAVYVAPNHVSIALDPDVARRVHERSGLKLQTKTTATSYIHVTADQLAEHASEVSELLTIAFDRADRGPRWVRGLPDRKTSRGELCPRCFQETSVTGTCANCD